MQKKIWSNICYSILTIFTLVKLFITIRSGINVSSNLIWTLMSLIFVMLILFSPQIMLFYMVWRHIDYLSLLMFDALFITTIMSYDIYKHISLSFFSTDAQTPIAIVFMSIKEFVLVILVVVVAKIIKYTRQLICQYFKKTN